MLSGAYTVPEVRRRLNDELGFRTLPTPRGGGKPMSHSTLYALFSNPFYAGYFKHGGQMHRGAHPPMVSWSEFERVQSLIGRQTPMLPGQNVAASAGRRCSQGRDLTFCGVLRCSVCGGQVTGHTIRKASGRTYTYYFCQNAKKTCRKIGVREEALDALVLGELERLFFLPEFDEWAQNELGLAQAGARKVQEDALVSAQDALDRTNKQLDSLLSLKLKELLSDDEFSAKRATLLAERERLQRSLDEAEGAHQRAHEAVSNALDFLATAKQHFQSGDNTLRRAVALALSSNWTFAHGKVLLEPHPLLEALRRCHQETDVAKRLIKPVESSSRSTKKGPLEPVCSLWSSKLDDVQTLALHHSWFFPKLPAPK